MAVSRLDSTGFESRHEERSRLENVQNICEAHPASRVRRPVVRLATHLPVVPRIWTD